MAYTLDPALPQADIHLIKRMIPHRYPFLMIDRVANIEVNRFAIGIKNVTVNEPHFEGHFPVRPVMPGVLIIEAMAQTSAVLVVETLALHDSDRLVYFMGIDSAKFRGVQPGDQLELHVTVLRGGNGSGASGARPSSATRSSPGGFRGDDHVARRCRGERLTGWQSIPPQRSTRPPSSPKAPVIGAGAEVGPFCVVGPGRHAAGVVLHNHVAVAGVTQVGEGTQIFPFASIGHAPQDLKYAGERVELVIGRPQPHP